VSAVTSDAVAHSPPRPGWSVWAGRVISAIPVLALVLSASMKLSQKPEVVAMFTSKLGYPAGVLVGLGLLELACAAIYVVPRTSVLGAILLTGYLGGAIATHVRVGEAFVLPLVLGILVWLGLYLRETRLRALAPLRT
jgi:hypothetical protein